MADNLDRIRSSIPGMIWPGVPDYPGSLLLALQYQLERTQWWPPSELERHQLQELSALLRHAHDSMPFWRGRLAASGYDPRAEITRDWLSRLPTLTRSEVQAQGEAMLCPNVPAAHGEVDRGETSGSTGKPVRYFATALTQLYWRAFTLRDHMWHKRDFSGTLAAIRPRIAGGDLPGWGPATDGAFVTGRCATLSIRTDLDAQLDWLVRQRPSYLITQADNLHALARLSLETGARLPGLLEARSYGSTLREDARGLVLKAWGVPLSDIYTAEEVGYIALQCPGHDHYHAQSENLIVEILDENGRPCPPGAIGRVVLTSLHNFAMPLIRYELGDYAEAGAPCPCGRGLPVITRILGRGRNVLTLPDGRQRWPSFASEKWSDIAPVRQLQLIQKSREEILVRVVAPRELAADEKARLIKALQDSLGHPFRMPVEQVAEIPRSASYKFEDFISEIA